jgi:hypothetical protein
MESFKITRPGAPYEAPHIGPRLAKKLETHRWHVLRIPFDKDPQPESKCQSKHTVDRLNPQPA